MACDGADDLIHEYDGQSELDLAWSSSCYKLAQHLIKKGSRIGSFTSIQMGRFLTKI